jgi:Asp-tRNA(Asn)/Glu-tRNA(Gln) amidotransferase A subunit family amidase
MLDLIVRLLEHPLTGPLLARPQLDDLGLSRLRALPVADPVPAVHPLFEDRLPTNAGSAPLALPEPSFEGAGFRFETAANFVEAYRSGRTTPLEVAERLLGRSGELDRLDPPMRLLIAQDAEDLRSQARESTERYRKGAPLGPLDGVPVAIKDEVDQVPYPTTAGTRFLGREPATRDAETVARFRAAGALLLGKANMHEIGLGVSGINPHHGTPRNPYDPARIPGGSSGGSAAAVAAGLSPLALGADAGGSIRIPAGLCGVVGLKPTFGRVSEHGAAPICWSVAHLGPFGATARDAALGYLAMAGPDEKDANTRFQPSPHLQGFGERDLRGFRLGVYRDWFEDAEASVVTACRRTLDVLREAGAEIVEVEIPELGLLRLIHSITTVAEMLAAHQQYYERHPEAFGHEVRVNFALLRQVRSDDYLLVQRHRARLHRQVMAVMQTIDGLVTPATAVTARPIAPGAARYGESNLPLMGELMRYMPLANLTGLPAIVFPAGYDPDGLPIGLQVIGRAWEEAFLLRVAQVAERHVERRAPVVHHRLLTKAPEAVPTPV